MNDSRSNSQKVLSGISSQTIVTIVLGVVEIVSFSFLSRLLTKEDFGYYAAISAITIIFSTFADTGIGSSIVQCKNLTKRYIDNAFTLSVIIGVAVMLLLLSLSGILARTIADGSMTVPLMLMSVTLFLQSLTSVFTSLMHRRLEFLRIGMIYLVSLVITTVVAVWLAYDGYGYYAIITKIVMYWVLIFIMSFYMCKTRFSIALDKRTASAIIHFSGWLMFSGLFRNISHQVDKLLMPRLLSVELLGAYNRPIDFVEHVSTKLNGIFDTALFPVLSSIQDEKEKLAKAFRQSLSTLNTFAMLLTLTFAFNSQLLIRIFFGDQWMSLNSITIIISFVLVFNIDGRLSDCYLRSLGMTKQQFFFRIFEAVLNILGVLIGSYWGITGVAISVVATNSIAKLIKIVFVASKIDVCMRETLLVIINSWRFTVVLIPIVLLFVFLLPNSVMGDVLRAVLFACTIIILFLYFPRLIGKDYENMIYPRIHNLVLKHRS